MAGLQSRVGSAEFMGKGNQSGALPDAATPTATNVVNHPHVRLDVRSQVTGAVDSDGRKRIRDDVLAAFRKATCS